MAKGKDCCFSIQKHIKLLLLMAIKCYNISTGNEVISMNRLRKNKENRVYCPNCGEISNASELYCSKCKESLKGAIAVDLDEDKLKIKRAKRMERYTKRRRRIEKREAIFHKFPILKPLYYAVFAALILLVPFILYKIYSFNHLLGSVLVTSLYIRFYIWYVPILVDYEDDFIAAFDLPEGMPYRYKHRKNLINTIWGAIITGSIIMLALLTWVYNCIPFFVS